MKRLKEPSTWAGIAAMLLAVSSMLPPPWGAYLHAGAVAAGALAGAMPEGEPA